MKTTLLFAVCAITLTGCGFASGGNQSAFLSNGNDTSFLEQGTSNCPGVIESGNPIYERYPLRCGPQMQVIPR